MGHCSHQERSASRGRALKCTKTEEQLRKFKVTEELHWVAGIRLGVHREDKKRKARGNIRKEKKRRKS